MYNIDWLILGLKTPRYISVHSEPSHQFKRMFFVKQIDSTCTKRTFFAMTTARVESAENGLRNIFMTKYPQRMSPVSISEPLAYEAELSTELPSPVCVQCGIVY